MNGWVKEMEKSLKSMEKKQAGIDLMQKTLHEEQTKIRQAQENTDAAMKQGLEAISQKANTLETENAELKAMVLDTALNAEYTACLMELNTGM